MTNESMTDVRQELANAQAALHVHLETFGDLLAKRKGWTNVSGIEAVQYFLMQKHHWLPAQVKSLSWDDLQFAMSEELEAARATPESRAPAVPA